MILVIGGTGRLGREVVRRLTEGGARGIRTLSRDPSKASSLVAHGVEILPGGITDADALARAVRGVERLLVIPPNIPEQARAEAQVYDLARRAGVRHVLKLSTSKADFSSACRFFSEHAAAEECLKGAGVRFTILRANSFMQNLLWFAPEVRARRTLSLPMGDAPTAPVDLRDVAAVAAAILSAQTHDALTRHDGLTYNVTGPEKLSFAEVARKLSAAAGVEIEYRDVSPAAFVETLTGAGLPRWYAEAVAASWEVARRGEPVVSDVVARVAQTSPTTFDRFAREHRRAFIPDEPRA